jgi:2'-5' RNA ligase
MHLTVKFLGDTEPARVAPLVDAVSAVTGNILPFPFSVHGAGAYPNLKRPRVLWAGVIESSATLLRLVEGVEVETEKMGWPREIRKYSPHITIGRVKGNMNLGRLAAAMDLINDRHWGDQEAGELFLYRSHLGKGGARYEKVHVFKLGK